MILNERNTLPGLLLLSQLKGLTQMEFIQIKHISNYMGWHEVTYKVEGVDRSEFIDKLQVINRFIESPQHPFIKPYGVYDVDFTKDSIYLIHEYDTSG